MRGVNHAHTWYPGETQSLADIKALGANTVRVVLSDGHRWTRNSPADVANVVAQCKANRLICVLEVHDTTGYGEEAVRHARPRGRLLDQPQGRPRSARRTTSSSTSATSPGATPTRRAGPPPPSPPCRNCGPMRLRAHDHGGRAQLGPGLAGRHARQRPVRVRRRHHRQPDLLDPHVQRLRHRRRDHRLPGRLRGRRTAPPHRRVRRARRPVGRSGRGHHDGHRRGAGPRLPGLVLERQHRPGPRPVDRLRPHAAQRLGLYASSTAPTASRRRRRKPRSSAAAPRATPRRRPPRAPRPPPR